MTNRAARDAVKGLGNAPVASLARAGYNGAEMDETRSFSLSIPLTRFTMEQVVYRHRTFPRNIIPSALRHSRLGSRLHERHAADTDPLRYEL